MKLMAFMGMLLNPKRKFKHGKLNKLHTPINQPADINQDSNQDCDSNRDTGRDTPKPNPKCRKRLYTEGCIGGSSDLLDSIDCIDNPGECDTEYLRTC